METDRKSVRVTIYNQTYTLAVSGDPAEVESLAQSVDTLMGEIARGGNVDGHRVAVLASLHLADRLRTLERELTDLKARVDAKSRHFAMLLDQAAHSD
jgi:cell division protein ZapA (FtsZ GTPase activity inhibitor)